MTDSQQPQGEWAMIQELEARLDRGEELTLDEEMKELLRKVGDQVDLDPTRVSQQVESAQGAEELIREARGRIRNGSIAFSRALGVVARCEEEGNLQKARSILESFIQTETVPWYRELARRELRDLGKPQAD